MQRWKSAWPASNNPALLAVPIIHAVGRPGDGDEARGIALGIDRWVMLFGGLDNIRDCIAFPKTQRAADLMTGAPGAVEAKQLKELGIKLSQ